MSPAASQSKVGASTKPALIRLLGCELFSEQRAHGCPVNNLCYGLNNVSDLDALLSIAVDLTASLASQDRLTRLLEAVRRAIPCDAAAVLELAEDDLIPLAIHGLAPEVLGRRHV
jgi:transcriptional regulator with GAF, ATPase, and Fis domain